MGNDPLSRLRPIPFLRRSFQCALLPASPIPSVPTYVFVLLFLCCPAFAKAQVTGCTDPHSTNYDPKATQNDGSCLYAPAAIIPETTLPLVATLKETSGLAYWDGKLWTHNDSGDLTIYALDPETGAIVGSYPLPGQINTDWEEISQDLLYFYVGDVGNNVSGNRRDLNILKVEKASLLTGKPNVEKISFSYADQFDYARAPANQTDYDCEAFFVDGDFIYLLTKQWTGQQTKIYTLDNSPGIHSAQPLSSFDVNGLVTGAVFLKEHNLLALSGYKIKGFTISPFIELIHGFEHEDFNKGNRRRIDLDLPMHQVEGITTTNGMDFYITNESLVKLPFLNVPQRLHKIDLGAYTRGFLDHLKTPLMNAPFDFKTRDSIPEEIFKLDSLDPIIRTDYEIIKN